MRGTCVERTRRGTGSRGEWGVCTRDPKALARTSFSEEENRKAVRHGCCRGESRNLVSEGGGVWGHSPVIDRERRVRESGGEREKERDTQRMRRNAVDGPPRGKEDKKNLCPSSGVDLSFFSSFLLSSTSSACCLHGHRHPCTPLFLSAGLTRSSTDAPRALLSLVGEEGTKDNQRETENHPNWRRRRQEGVCTCMSSTQTAVYV